MLILKSVVSYLRIYQQHAKWKSLTIYFQALVMNKLFSSSMK